MIDWHSHILPKVDDGSKSVEESLAILRELKLQGVDTVIATPHFYANDESVEEFLKRRQKAYENLKPSLSADLPEIHLGAEVSYYTGISRLEGLCKLKIEGSDLLLLEMPVAKWTEYTVRELVELSSLVGTRIMLAHVERYFPLQSSETLERLYESGILTQMNAGCLLRFSTRRKAIRALKDGAIHFIGTDCHNLSSRPPKMADAVSVISKKIGEDFIIQMNEYGLSVFA